MSSQPSGYDPYATSESSYDINQMQLRAILAMQQQNPMGSPYGQQAAYAQGMPLFGGYRPPAQAGFFPGSFGNGMVGSLAAPLFHSLVAQPYMQSRGYDGSFIGGRYNPMAMLQNAADSSAFGKVNYAANELDSEAFYGNLMEYYTKTKGLSEDEAKARATEYRGAFDKGNRQFGDNRVMEIMNKVLLNGGSNNRLGASIYNAYRDQSMSVAGNSAKAISLMTSINDSFEGITRGADGSVQSRSGKTDYGFTSGFDKQDIAEVVSAVQNGAGLSDDTRQAKRQIAETNRGLRELADMVGSPDAPVGEMIKLLKELGGGEIGGENQAQLQQQIRQATAISAIGKIDPAALTNLARSNADSLAGLGLTREGALGLTTSAMSHVLAGFGGRGRIGGASGWDKDTAARIQNTVETDIMASSGSADQLILTGPGGTDIMDKMIAGGDLSDSDKALLQEVRANGGKLSDGERGMAQARMMTRAGKLVNKYFDGSSEDLSNMRKNALASRALSPEQLEANLERRAVEDLESMGIGDDDKKRESILKIIQDNKNLSREELAVVLEANGLTRGESNRIAVHMDENGSLAYLRQMSTADERKKLKDRQNLFAESSKTLRDLGLGLKSVPDKLRNALFKGGDSIFDNLMAEFAGGSSTVMESLVGLSHGSGADAENSMKMRRLLASGEMAGVTSLYSKLALDSMDGNLQANAKGFLGMEREDKDTLDSYRKKALDGIDKALSLGMLSPEEAAARRKEITDAKTLDQAETAFNLSRQSADYNLGKISHDKNGAAVRKVSVKDGKLVAGEELTNEEKKKAAEKADAAAKEVAEKTGKQVKKVSGDGVEATKISVTLNYNGDLVKLLGEAVKEA